MFLIDIIASREVLADFSEDSLVILDTRLKKKSVVFLLINVSVNVKLTEKKIRETRLSQ